MLFRWLVDRFCGEWGTKAIDATDAWCLQGSNPLGQASFLTLFGACYAAGVVGVFPLLDSTGMAGWYKYVSQPCLLLCEEFLPNF